TAGNHFDGVVHLTGGETQILSDGALSLGVLNVASLSARTNGVLDAGSGIVSGIMSAQGTSVSQSGALVVGGASLFAGSAGVTLANAGNDFIGAVHLTGGSDTTIHDSNALWLNLAVTGDLTATSSGALGL